MSRLVLRVGTVWWLLAVSLGIAGEIRFENQTAHAGLAPYLEHWAFAHAGAWGDVTGNGYPDLFFAPFADRPMWAASDAPIPNLLFLNRGDGTFELSPSEPVRMQGDRARVSMALMADFTNSGKLDLVLGMHGRGPQGPILFRNRGNGEFVQDNPTRGDWPLGFHSRNMMALDFDRDGLLDLLLVDGTYGRAGQQKLVALRNLGDGTFEEITEQLGLPGDRTRGLGSAIGDINEDGYPDIFIADSNRMFLSNGDGTYREYRPGFFREPRFRDWPCGAVLADLTGNGLLDLMLTIHSRPPQLFLFINRGPDANGDPIFEEVTAAAGLRQRFPRDGITGEPLKAAALSLVDLNHNGRRDLLLGMVHMDPEKGLQPVVYRNMGTVDGIPRFEGPPVDQLVGYYPTAPVADYDRDGRMDVAFASWFNSIGSHLFRNTSDAGNYLVVSVRGEAPGFNRMGIGATVRVYRAGHLGNPEHLLGRGDISLGNGYTSTEETIAHFGLANESLVDIEVRWQDRTIQQTNIPTNQYHTILFSSP